MKVEIIKPSGELIAGLGEWTPTYRGMTTPDEQRYETGAGNYIVKDGTVYGCALITFRADTREFNRHIDMARRALDRLRYPPKAPARGSISRRREKLRKAGLRPR